MVQLDKESTLLTTLNTPWGKFRWLWLPFDLSVSSDVFQKRLHAVIKTVSGVTVIADDVLAKGESERNYDIAVLSLLETGQNNNLKYDPDKDSIQDKRV